MSTRRLVLITVVFIAALTAVRLGWIVFRAPPPRPPVSQGVLDLREWNFGAGRPTTLNGEWAFYPNELLGQANEPHTSAAPIYDNLPNTKRTGTPSSDVLHDGYGSFRMRVLLPLYLEAQDELLGMRVLAAGAASSVYVNGKFVGGSGHPAATADAYIAEGIPYTVSFPASGAELDIIIEVANYIPHQFPNIYRPILFGTEQSVTQEQWLQQMMQLSLVLVMAVHIGYALLLYSFGVRQRVLVYFAIATAAGILLTLVVDDKLLYTALQIDFRFMQRIDRLAGFVATVMFPAFVAQVTGNDRLRTISHWVMLGLIPISVLMLTIPPEKYQFVEPALISVYAAAFIATPVMIVPVVRKAERGGLLLLLGAIALTGNAVWGLAQQAWATYWGFYPFDFLIVYAAFTAHWFQNYVRTATGTERLATELQMRDKHRDQFLANTSHELRNPLHGMLNLTHALLEQDGQTLTEKQRAQLGLMQTIGRRMTLQLNDLLDFARLREHGLSLQRSSVHLSGIVAGVTDLIQYTAPLGEVQIVNDIPPSFPAVCADENRVAQIVFNLLHNAVKFTSEGTITVSAVVQSDMASVSVADTGVGIDGVTLARIFDPYVQGDTAMAEAGGLGLGLSISQRLVERHGGKLTATSQLGSGSTLTFTLPLAPKQPNHANTVGQIAAAPLLVSATATPNPLPPTPPPIDADSPRIAVMAVDDDPVNLAIIADMLNPNAYDVVTALNGADALSLLENRQWNLLIVDAMMPGMSGYELTRRVRERFSVAELPILILTARTQPDDLAAAFEAGANDFVTKPVDPLELRARVAALASLTVAAGQQLRLETAMLQAQIQPHFLFNTLNSIAALSDVDPERMRSLLTVFGDYLRSSFDFRNLARLVPLQRELDLVRSYVYIQSERFGDRLRIHWHVDETLAADPNVHIPPLTIQPLVENAVTHGALAQRKGGTVTIHIARYDGGICIKIIDDGPGLDQKTWQACTSGDPQPDQGIGLQHTHRRLKQLFGHGLTLESEAGQGTTISFTVPLP